MMDFLVNVVLVTYNQDKYVARAIESVLLQETNFRYNIIIGEDHSSDNTLAICKSFHERFPDRILLISSEENTGLVKNYRRVFNACAAKYIAILEGDDYWIDPLKLQKQVDILEKDQETALVHTNLDKLLPNGRIIQRFKSQSLIKPKDGYVYDELIKENFIASITTCFRRDFFEKWVDYDELINRDLVTIDYSIWLELSYHGKVKYIDDSTAVYRILETSLSNSTDFTWKEVYYNKGRNIKKYYLRKYPAGKLTGKDIDRVYDMGLFIWAIKLKNRVKAIEYYMKLDSVKFPVNMLKMFLKVPILFTILSRLFSFRRILRPFFRKPDIREYLNLR